jgi:hypothetical protein
MGALIYELIRLSAAFIILAIAASASAAEKQRWLHKDWA